MRSRYSAYVLGLETYLLASWHPDTRPEALNLATDAPLKWLGLKILGSQESGDTATVHFVARYRQGGRARFIDEQSRFIRIAGRWLYIDGVVS
jgi:SEC-C motif-containing protein